VSTSYSLCDSILRDRRFGVVPESEIGLQRGGLEGLDMSFLVMNPPDHGRLRQLAAPGFTRKAVLGYQPQVEKITAQLLDSAARLGRFDLMDALAAPLPIAVICWLMGIPDADMDAIRDHGEAVGLAIDGIQSLRHAADLQKASVELSRLFDNLFELRRSEPGQDLVSPLVAAEGDQLKPGEMLSMCVLLLLTGHETTSSLIGSAVVALLDNPEQWQALVADPALAAKAVEETLRYDPPVQVNPRFALEQVDIAGQRVLKGQQVISLIGAANRDPQAYDHPDTFDITRTDPAPHLAFSSGIHYCLGAQLAVLEGTVALRMLAERMPRLTRVGAVQRRKGTTFRGPRRLPVAAGLSALLRRE